ncbi:hypothetical protein ACIBF6_14800 [Streptosporangium amethystogenes]|uniref:hypothetical protein n=1 Tax=Streptosporangium amethystogenes TaxID=2002 RepID=UPI00379FEBBB
MFFGVGGEFGHDELGGVDVVVGQAGVLEHLPDDGAGAARGGAGPQDLHQRADVSVGVSVVRR